MEGELTTLLAVTAGPGEPQTLPSHRRLAAHPTHKENHDCNYYSCKKVMNQQLQLYSCVG